MIGSDKQKKRDYYCESEVLFGEIERRGLMGYQRRVMIMMKMDAQDRSTFNGVTTFFSFFPLPSLWCV